MFCLFIDTRTAWRYNEHPNPFYTGVPSPLGRGELQLWLIRRCRHCSVIQLAFVLSYPNCQLTTEKRANLEIGSLCNLCIVSWDYKHPCEWAYKFWSTLKNGAPLVGHGKFRLPRQPYSRGKGKKICFMLASGVLLLVFGQSINNS